jgi:Secretion system C-terminal sorting domain
MKTKFYQKSFKKAFAILAFAVTTQSAIAQTQGLYIDTIKYTNATTASVVVRCKGMSNFISAQGSITWNKQTLKYTSSTANAALGSTLFSFGSAAVAVATGKLTYSYLDGSLTTHTVADGTPLFTMNFTVQNNPDSTFYNNVIAFSNAPTPLEIDTADASGLPAALLFPALENHTSGYVSYARPPFLTYSGGTITDTITNRPPGCTFQWYLNGNPITGPASGTFPNSPAGTVSLVVTYPGGNATAATSNSSILPVKLANFVGKTIESKNQLMWTTASEENTNSFVVERSNNGKEFAALAKIKAIGNSTTNQNYSFVDANVDAVTTLYYRLKIADNNGSFSYSEIVKLSNQSKATISVYPNPTKDFVKVSGNKISKIVINNLLGKQVFTKLYDNTNAANINVASFAKGIYTISIVANNVTETSKLIVD